MTQQRRCNIVNFNDGNTINIFTDASTTTYNGETYVSAGAVAIIGENYNNIIDQQVNVMKNTNNYGELYAIYLAIMISYFLLKVKNHTESFIIFIIIFFNFSVKKQLSQNHDT